MKIIYNFEDYKKCVLSFAEDTKEWEGLDERRWYTACNTYESWEETTDNSNGGLDIRWAFHRENISNTEILEHFYEEIMNILNTNIDNEVDIESIEFDY